MRKTNRRIRNSRRRQSRKRLTKKRLTRKRLTKKRLTRKKLSKRRLSRRRQRGGMRKCVEEEDKLQCVSEECKDLYDEKCPMNCTFMFGNSKHELAQECDKSRLPRQNHGIIQVPIEREKSISSDGFKPYKK